MYYFMEILIMHNMGVRMYILLSLKCSNKFLLNLLLLLLLKLFEYKYNN